MAWKRTVAKEVIDEFAKFNMEDYDEVVFCGFGEPTEAFDVLKEVLHISKRHITSLLELTQMV